MGRSDNPRTPEEDGEATALLRELDRIVVRLWELDIDTSLRVPRVLRDAVDDGVKRGSGTITGMAKRAADKALAKMRRS